MAFLVVEPRVAGKGEEAANGGEDAGAGVFASVRHFLAAMKAFFGNRRIVAVSAANAVSGALGESCYQFSAAFFSALWPVWAIGFSKTISSVGAAVSFRASGRAIDRFGAFPVLVASRAYGRVVGIAASLFPGPWSPVITSTSSLFFGTGVVASETLMQREYSDGQRATMGSIGSMLENTLFAIAAPLLGWFADRIGVVQAYLWVQVAMIPSVIALWFEHRRRNGEAGARRAGESGSGDMGGA